MAEFTETLENAVYQFATEYIKRLFRDINTNLLRKFNTLFKKDENGKNRDWKSIEEGQIRDLHVKCKAVMEGIIKQFKFISIPKPGAMNSPTRPTPDGGLN